MTKLEKFYLTIVINSLTESDVLSTFIQINKKCQEVIEMMKMNPLAICIQKEQYEDKNQLKNQYTNNLNLMYSTMQLKNELEMFQKFDRIETIQLTAELFIIFQEYLKKESLNGLLLMIKNRFYSYLFHYLNGFEERIVSFHLFIEEYHSFSEEMNEVKERKVFQKWKALKSLTLEIDTENEYDILSLLPEKSHYLKKLHIKSRWISDELIVQLKEYKIETIVIESKREVISSLSFPKQMGNILFVTDDWNDEENKYVINWTIDQNNHSLFQKLYYPHSICIHGKGLIDSFDDEIDWSSYSHLQHITLSTFAIPILLPSSILSFTSSELPPEECNHLQSFSLKSTQSLLFGQLPLSLTSLQLTKAQLLIEDPLPELHSLSIQQLSTFFNPSLELFSQLTSVKIEESFLLHSTFPDSLKQLSIIRCMKNNKYKQLLLPSQLTSFQLIDSDFVFPLTFPTTLQSIELEQNWDDYIELEHLHQLQDVIIRKSLWNVKLPTIMRYLRLHAISPTLSLDLSEYKQLHTFIYENGNEKDQIILPFDLYQLVVYPTIPTFNFIDRNEKKHNIHHSYCILLNIHSTENHHLLSQINQLQLYCNDVFVGRVN